jgi:putative ABC transport system permease protein
MNIGESIRISWRSVTGHKLRSTLTTLGVVIGIGSVIALVILGGAFTENVVGDINTDNQPVIGVSTQIDRGTGIQFLDAPIYTQSDVEAIERIDGVEYVARYGSVPAVQLSHGNETQTGGFQVRATDAELFESDGSYNLTDGETFSAEDEAVVTQTLATRLETNLTVGDRITFTAKDGQKTTVTVTGIVENKIEAGRSPVVYVPLDPHYNTTVTSESGEVQNAYEELTIGVEGVERIEEVKPKVQTYFETESDAKALAPDNAEIAVQTSADVVDRITGIIDTITTFVGGVAAISLVVGSIGIANIMIVSVTERTREIGIMKAIGARKRDIIQLFMIESIILGGIGAVLGVALGVGVGYLGTQLTGWPMVVELGPIAAAVAVGIGVGVVSGLYPAWRGARVDPIEALRRE